MSLSKIKDAILQFSFEEREELNRLLCGWKQDSWDNQIGEDVAPGLDKIITRAEAGFKGGPDVRTSVNR